MTTPLITIGLTCYNAGDTIGRALDSALHQAWPAKEIIVVDDASIDSSFETLQRYRSAHPELRVIRHQINRGYAGAINSIFAAARGDFIAIFDDDDCSVPDRLSEQWARITEYESKHKCRFVLCYSNRNVVKSASGSPDHIAKAIGRHSPEPHGTIVADFLFGHGTKDRHAWGLFGSCTLMARRESLLAIGRFDESFRRCAEWDFAVRAASMGCHFIAVDKPLITQYKTKGAEKAGTLPLKFALLLCKKHKQYLRSKGAYVASLLYAHARFHRNKGRTWKGIAFLVCSRILLPPGTLARKIRCRVLKSAPGEYAAPA